MKPIEIPNVPGFEDETMTVFLAWEDQAVALDFIDVEDGWRNAEKLLHPDEAEGLAAALIEAATELRRLWAERDNEKGVTG